MFISRLSAGIEAVVFTLPSASPPFTSHLMHNRPSSGQPQRAAFPRSTVSRTASGRFPPTLGPWISNFHPPRYTPSHQVIHNTTTMDASWEMLQELDPSPIDSPYPELAEEDRNDLLPEVVKDTAGTGTRPGSGIRSPPSHVLGLSGLGAGHGAVYYRK